MKTVMKAEIPADFAELYHRAKEHLLNQTLGEAAPTSPEQELHFEVKVWQTALLLQRKDLRLREADLQIQNRLIEAAQSLTRVGSVEMNVATRELRWSAETYRIHDTTPEEFNPTLDDNLEYYTPESRPIISAALKAALEEGKVFDIAVDKYTMKGRKIHIRTTCIPTYENGKSLNLPVFIKTLPSKSAKKISSLKKSIYCLNPSALRILVAGAGISLAA